MQNQNYVIQFQACVTSEDITNWHRNEIDAMLHIVRERPGAAHLQNLSVITYKVVPNTNFRGVILKNKKINKLL